MDMSPPLDNNSNQLQDCDDDKANTKPLFNQTSVAVKGVCDDGKACFSNASSVIYNQYQYAAGRSDGFNATVDEGVGGKPFVKILVPVKNGHTTVNVRCFAGDVEDMRYRFKRLDDQYPKHMTKLRVKGVPPIVNTMQTHSEEFFDAVEHIEEHYDARLCQVNKGCLCLEFEHTSAEKAQEMAADIHKVTRIFKDFAQKCGFPSENVTVEAEYEFVKQPGQAQTEEENTVQLGDVPKTDVLHKEKEEITKQLDHTPIPGQAQTDKGRTVQLGDVPKTDASDKRKEEITIQLDHTPISVSPRMAENLSMQRKAPTHSLTELSFNISRQQLSSDSGCVGTSSYSSGEESEDAVPLKDSLIPTARILDDEYKPARLDGDVTYSSSVDHSRMPTGFFVGNINQPIRLYGSSILLPHSHSLMSTARMLDDEYKPARLEGGSVSLAIWSDQETMSYEVKRQLIGLRNGGGGRLKIHTTQIEMHADFLDCFLPQCMNACLLDDEFCNYVYTVEEEEDVTTIDAEKCSKLITLDYHSKIALGKDLINLNRRQMIELIQGGHNRLTTKSKIRGKAHDMKNGQTVAFKQGDPEIVTDTSKFVKRLFADLNLREYISAFSRNKEGGSYILPLKVSDEQELKSALQDHIMKNMIVLDTSYRWRTRWSHPPEDLTTIVFHPPESIESKHLLEVSVRPFDGIVFYDKEGPESYKMNDQGQLVRLTKEEWLDGMLD